MLNQKHSGGADERRFSKLPALLLIMILFAMPALIAAQAESPVIKINEAAARADIAVENLRGNISLLTGSGGNIVVFNGLDGKLLVDAGIGVSRQKIEAALDRIGPTPIKYLINTHWHWDHTDGNEWVRERGATVIAHENVLKLLMRSERVEDWKFTFQPLPAAGLPTVTFKTEKTLKFGGETIVMKHFGNGHTDGDISVYFQKADVLVLGDIFWNDAYPFIDNAHGGGINDMIRWADIAIKRTTDKTVVVPGHGPAGDRKQLREYRDMLADVRDRVKSLKKQGKMLDQVLAAKPGEKYDAKWGGFVIDPKFFIRLVYAGV